MTWDHRGESSTSDTDGVLTQTPLEARAQIENLDALQARRRQLVKQSGDLTKQNDKLVALHGPFGQYDDHRKRMVEAQKIKARMDLSAGQEKKPTEAAIDAAAYGSEEYGRFIDQALSERIEYVRMGTEIDAINNEIADINERIRSREEEMRFVRAEMGLER